MKRARNTDGKMKKRFTVFLASFLTVITAFVIVLGFHSVLFPLSDSEAVIDEDYVAPVDKATGKANVLLLGVDKDGLRTDTIIFASYDLDNNKVNMLSIPRDTRMYIGGRFQKINAAHSLTKNGKIKGPQGTIEAVTRLTGMPINYYVEFSFEAFRNTIDALGGVEFDVPQRMYYRDPAQDLYIDLQAGLQTLDGDKAEQLVRFRQYPRGDIQRVETQQAFVKALAEQKLNIGLLTKIPDIFKTLQKDIDTNFKVSDVLKYLPNLKELSPENVTMYQLPGDFSGAEYSASYWLVNISELKTLVSETFGYPEAAEKVTTGAKGVVDSGADKVTTPKKTESTKTNNKTTTNKNTTTQKTETNKTDDDEDEFIEIPDAEETEKTEDTAEPTASLEPTVKPTASPKPTSTPTAKPTSSPKPTATPKPAEDSAADTNDETDN
ncbi:MAG: LCP family protein [Clostridia bacterium]|nr:LCP family protein [Clostridia bacterium]